MDNLSVSDGVYWYSAGLVGGVLIVVCCCHVVVCGMEGIGGWLVGGLFGLDLGMFYIFLELARVSI